MSGSRTLRLAPRGRQVVRFAKRGSLGASDSRMMLPRCALAASYAVTTCWFESELAFVAVATKPFTASRALSSRSRSVSPHQQPAHKRRSGRLRLTTFRTVRCSRRTRRRAPHRGPSGRRRKSHLRQTRRRHPSDQRGLAAVAALTGLGTRPATRLRSARDLRVGPSALGLDRSH